VAGRERKRGECQTLLGVSLARNRRSPKRPPEPRPSGVHPEEAKWDDGTQVRLFGRGAGQEGALLTAHQSDAL
jgi:hypothetical protein